MSKSSKRFSNPIIKDEIEIISESEEKLIFRTYLSLGGGQQGLHYHSKITEKFKIITGELTVILNSAKKILRPNDEVIITKFDRHQFLNESEENVIFEVEISPPGEIIMGLQILYGLAKDGKVYKSGLPKNIFYMGIGLSMMDAYTPLLPMFVQKLVISILALIGKIIGLENKLILKYCTETN